MTAARKRHQATVRLRRPRPGDLGWVVSRHGALYAMEYGYDHRFEGLVAKIVGEFVDHFDPERERCWIADLGGVPVGSVFLVKKTDAVAKLRLLLIEPSARGHGIGRKLVRACTTFARSRGYEAIELWTQSELYAARAIYVREGYTLVSTEAHAMFGRPGMAETWRLELK
jgi:GNAT superfamily N-acetyltransferase